MVTVKIKCFMSDFHWTGQAKVQKGRSNRVAMPLESPIKVLVEIGKSFLTNIFK